MDQLGLEGSSPPLAGQKAEAEGLLEPRRSRSDWASSETICEGVEEEREERGRKGRKKRREGRREKKCELYKAVDIVFVLVELIILNVYLHQNINYYALEILLFLGINYTPQ